MSTTTTRTILVIGATGKQGRCIIECLLKNKQFKVRALTRNTTSPKAKTLEQSGVEFFQGDVQSKDIVDKAMKGVYGVFLCLNPFEIGGTEHETRIGKEIVDLAISNKVQHFVYTSVASSERNTGIPHFESKRKVEEYLMKSGLTFTILKPVFFMENLLQHKEDIQKGTLPMFVKPTTRIQMIACCDIGAFGAMVFADKNTWTGKSVELAADEKTGEECAQILGCKFECLPLEKAPTKEHATMYKWLMEQNFKVDIQQLRKTCPNFTTFEKWTTTVGLKKTQTSY